MITHERLKELIEQESGCYVLNDYITGYIHLKPKYEPETYENGEHNYILYIYCDDKKKYKEEIFDEQLFETEEEAEWHKEFGCIERTERLDLPTWEEWQKDDEFDFLDKDGFSWDTYITGDNEIIMANGWEHFTFENNKEGYLLACRKAKELFLGEVE